VRLVTGHKLPTGYEDTRLMWLEVSVNGAVVSGSDAEQVDPSASDPQLRAYRFVPGHIDPTTHRAVRDDFVSQHTVVLEDTRIPPAGMVPDARTMPVGRDYSGGPSGALRNDDTATYALTAPTTPGPVTVTVRLLYRTTTQHYVDAVASRSGDRGRALVAAWEASGRAPPFAIATQSVTVNVAVGGGDAGDGASDAGVDGGNAHAPGGCGCQTTGRARAPAGAVVAVAMLGVMAVRRRARRG
jgi:hypothetical protein